MGSVLHGKVPDEHLYERSAGTRVQCPMSGLTFKIVNSPSWKVPTLPEGPAQKPSTSRSSATASARREKDLGFTLVSTAKIYAGELVLLYGGPIATPDEDNDANLQEDCMQHDEVDLVICTSNKCARYYLGNLAQMVDCPAEEFGEEPNVQVWSWMYGNGSPAFGLQTLKDIEEDEPLLVAYTEEHTKQLFRERQHYHRSYTLPQCSSFVDGPAGTQLPPFLQENLIQDSLATIKETVRESLQQCFPSPHNLRSVPACLAHFACGNGQPDS